MKKRPDSEYVSERLRDGLIVMETLLDAPSRGYSVADIERITGINYDKIRRALITLKLQGYARLFIGAWKPGERCRVFAARVDLAVVREQNMLLDLPEFDSKLPAFQAEQRPVNRSADVVALAESMGKF